MTIAKKSQLLDSLDGSDILLEEMPVEDTLADANELRMDDSAKSFSLPSSLTDLLDFEGEIALDIDQDSDPDVVLTLDKIPGAIDQEDIVEEEEIVVEEPEEVQVDDDPWSWSISNFIPWLSKMMQGVPTHSGKDTVGLERAIAYFETLDREISRAVRTDLNNEIAIDAVEKARDEIQRGIERLEDRLEKVKATKYPRKNKKNKKKADEEQSNLIKEAQKATHVGGIVVNVPLFISHVARVLINGMVSGGHDIEEMFEKLDAKYKFTDREKAEILQLLSDMNYPVRRDRGFLVDEEVDTTSTDNFDWTANYHA